MPQPTVTYLFDPLCGWCYGATPMIARLRAAGVALDALPTGLFAGDGKRRMPPGFAGHAWESDQRIARLSGQPFSQAYRQNVLGVPDAGFDLLNANCAIAAAGADVDDRLAALRAIQAARYVQGRDITDAATLAEVLREAGLAQAAQRLSGPDPALAQETEALVARGAALFRSLGADGVPALAVDGQRLLPAGTLFGNPEALLAQIAR
ncbi:MAG: DsbA family protein [Paracoccus aminovorans]|nr:DsbA family protein [Paracoccus aminovorans]